jgi:hypothetical protein
MSNNSFLSALDSSSGTGQQRIGISLDTFLASLVAALVVFTVQIFFFLLLKGKFNSI